MAADVPPSADDPEFAFTVAEPAGLNDADAIDEAPPLALLPTIGHVGRYALKQQLGMGGLGTVHAALDPLLGRAIAVKTLHLDPQAAQGETLEALLLHEARAAAALSHPHIVTVYDAGLAPEGVYIAMERLQGRDLRHLLADGWRPAPAEAALIVRRVADALAYAHSKGVIHCDIKPANIFMVGRAQPKVLDFGIARIAHADVPASRHALAAGSPFYMAPEQLRGEAVDARCDVYALGAVLYELLVGRRPFEGRTLDEIVQAVLHAPVEPARKAARGVPAALSDIAARAMARDPDQRFRSARHLSRALRSALGEAASARRPRAAAAAWPLAALAAVALAALLARWPRDAVDAESSAAAAAPSPSPSSVTPPAAGLPVADVASVAAPQAANIHASDERPPAMTLTAQRANGEPRARGSRLAAAAQPAATGVLRLAVSPWGAIEVNGAAAGTTPPLARLTLPAGTHTVVIRNHGFPPYRTRVTIGADRAATVRHRFGS